MLCSMDKYMFRYISTSTVRAPAEPTDAHRTVELTPWDLQLLLVGPIQKGLLFHKPETASAALIHHLKTSLSRTLHFFPPLAGRISRTDNVDGATATFSIDCNNAGAELVHAAADSVSVSDVLDAVYVPPVVLSFFPLNGVGNHEGVARPLLAVQVTELADGVFIGCTVNHVVADGTSFWHFFKSWSEISRGLDAVSKPPAFRRWFRDGDEYPVRIPLEKAEEKHVRLYRDYAPPPLLERIFHFRKESIAELKARANSEMGTDGRISSLQAVLAHLWRSVTRCRRLNPDDQEVSFSLIVGARPRLRQPPLPEHYFGNAVQFATTTMKASDVVEHGVGHAAWEINKIIALQTEEKLNSYLDSWIENPTLITMGALTNYNASLVATSSPRFDVYGNDFGWGRPIAVRCGAGNKSNGKLTLFSGSEEGSIEVHACLLPQTLYGVEKDLEFMDKVMV